MPSNIVAIERVAAMVLVFASISIGGPIEDLKPGEWYEVPNSHLQSVAPSGTTADVIDPWSGGAFDTKRDNLIVWGGGHGDYSGNEIYLFSLDSLKWARANNPSNPPAVDVPYAADGGPCSRHTYDYIQYVASIDRFCSFGGTGFYQSGQTGTNHTDAFNFDTKTWSALADVPDKAYGIGAFSALDAVTGHVWQHGCGGYSILAEFDSKQNSWVAHGGQWTESEYFSYYLTAAIDPIRRMFVAVGGGKQYYWDIDSAGPQTAHAITTTGDQTIVNAPSPGFEWSPTLGKFIAWHGGADIYTLDMMAREWKKVPPAVTNTVVPTAPAQWGTFGRWRYSPNKNVFVLVNSTTDNVFLYRFSSGSGTVSRRAPSLPASGSGPIRIISEGSPRVGEIGISLVAGQPQGRLAVYNATGKQMADLTNRIKNGVVVWKPTVQSGVYFVRLSLGKGPVAVKQVLF